MRRALTLAFSIPLAFAASCGDNGKTCTIHTAGDVKTLSCPDGTSTTITGSTGTGTTGDSGKDTLVSVADEPAGANCADGGKSITTGVDTNDDGVLQTSEVQSTSYVCNSTGPTPTSITGDVTVTNSNDIASLTGVTTITGTLTVDAPSGLTAISLPTLVHVGSLVINNGSGNGGPFHAAPPGGPAQPQGNGPSSGSGTLTSFSAPAINVIDHDLDITDDANTLTSLDLTGLQSAGSVFIDGTGLTSLSGLAHLTSVTSSVRLDSMQVTSLAPIAAVFGTFTGTVELDFDQSLTDIAAVSAVKTLDGFSMNGLPVTELHLPSLTAISGTVQVSSSSALTVIDLPVLGTVQGSIYIAYNSALTTISAPLLKSAGYFQIDDDSSYLTCFANALYAQLTNAPDRYVQYNADPTQTDPSCAGPTPAP